MIILFSWIFTPHVYSGHFNAILQAKKRSKKLVVGIHSDAEILANKGPPVMLEAERYQMLTHIKWVDEIAYDVPYSPSIEILDKYQCQKAFHGYELKHVVCCGDVCNR